MAKQYENIPEGQNWASLSFEISEDGKRGYVHNGSWHFEVIKFEPPYMKINVLHPRKSYEVEYFNVVKV